MTEAQIGLAVERDSDIRKLCTLRDQISTAAVPNQDASCGVIVRYCVPARGVVLTRELARDPEGGNDWLAALLFSGRNVANNRLRKSVSMIMRGTNLRRLSLYLLVRAYSFSPLTISQLLGSLSQQPKAYHETFQYPRYLESRSSETCLYQ